jgi:uncharacterized protein YjiS (DUF1127 family)
MLSSCLTFYLHGKRVAAAKLIGKITTDTPSPAKLMAFVYVEEYPAFKGTSQMPKLSKAMGQPVYFKVLSWFKMRTNLAELNALDSRMLLDIGLTRNEFHAAADPATPFERGARLHEASHRSNP